MHTTNSVVHQHDLVPHLGICCGREFGNISCLPLPTCPFHHNRSGGIITG